MKTVLITGAGGMLGSYLANMDMPSYEVISCTKVKGKNNLNIENSKLVKQALSTIKPDFIINSAAYTNVDNNELNKERAHNVNVNGLHNLIRYSNPATKIIHISTDYVFDGNKGNYLENDITRPVNYYGKCKLESENILIGSNRPYVIFRPNVLFDFFNPNFLTYVYNSLKNNKNINIVYDQISNPVFIPDFARAIFDSILLDAEGIFHYGSLESLSRYDFAVQIAKSFNLNSNLINKVSSESLNQVAIRPFNTTLNCNKIVNNFDIELLPVSYYLKKNKLR